MNYPKFFFTINLLYNLFFLNSFSQENFIPGQIIKCEGDTIEGFIDYRNWGANPKEVTFKSSKESETTVFLPFDIKEFVAEHDAYYSAIVEKELSPVATQNLNTLAKLNIQVDTVFLRKLVSGPKSLYYLRMKEGKDQFYIQRDSVFDLLVYKRYLDASTFDVRENIMYLRQLSLYFQDCPEIQTKLKTIDYKQKNLEKLFSYYYDCVDIEFDLKTKEEKVKLDFGVLAGVSFTFLEFLGTFEPFLLNTDFSMSTNFTGGVFLDIIFPRNQRKWSIYNELSYSAYSASGTYSEYENENRYTITESELGYSYFKINTMLRFKYPMLNAFIFANAGISNGYAFTETNLRKVETKFFTREDYIESELFDETRRYEQGLLFGVGTKFKKLTFEMRYERGNGMSTIALNSIVNRIYLLMGYTF